MDYVVKTTIDRGDGSILEVQDDLTVLNSHVKLSGKDLGMELESMIKSYENLKLEHKVTKGGLPEKPESDLDCLSFDYVLRLGERVEYFQERYDSLLRLNKLQMRKLVELAEYFGEDPKECDSPQIFGVLQSFYKSILRSKVAYEKNLNQ